MVYCKLFILMGYNIQTNRRQCITETMTYSYMRISSSFDNMHVLRTSRNYAIRRNSSLIVRDRVIIGME